jgi:Na+/H+ antiporter NhaD/arsenite permease-like protein
MEVLDPHAKWMLAVFILGYFFITIEHLIRIDKATTALLMGIICWIIQYMNGSSDCAHSLTCLGEHIGNISQIIFFLLGALAIVEIINAHKGFAIVADMLQIKSLQILFWVVGIITFILSSVLDNLTTTIVMVTLLHKIVEDREQRWLIGGGVVIAANAGGAWSPIGDVTTTMLWIDGQVTTLSIMKNLIVPSLAVLAASFLVLSFSLKRRQAPMLVQKIKQEEPMGNLIFFLGIATLFGVPIFKLVTGLPPFMGILFGLSLLWLVTDILHGKERDRQHLRVHSILRRIDLSSLLFFLGILLAIDALDYAGILHALAHWLDQEVGNATAIAALIGVASAVVDNVPLVAASMGMYPLEQYPRDHTFWQLIALCAGTGGSMLIIGSAAGVVYMGLEKVSFLWYLRRISLSALVGYAAGILVYLYGS